MKKFKLPEHRNYLIDATRKLFTGDTTGARKSLELAKKSINKFYSKKSNSAGNTAGSMKGL